MSQVTLLQKNSIISQFIKIVFAVYCMSALVITSFQISAIYQNTRQTIERELAVNEQVYNLPLSVAVWNLDQQQVLKILNGMVAMPTIKGVKVLQDRQLYKAVGLVKNGNNQSVYYSDKGAINQSVELANDELFSYQFPINYFYRGEKRHLGYAVLYSSESVVKQRGQIAVISLIFNSLLQLSVLLLLCIVLSKRILLTPINCLIDAIQVAKAQSFTRFNAELDANMHGNKEQMPPELEPITTAFTEITTEVAEARNKVINADLILEEQVKERTYELMQAKELVENESKVKNNFLVRISDELFIPINSILTLAGKMQRDSASEKLSSKDLGEQLTSAGNHLAMLLKDSIDIVATNKERFILTMTNIKLDEVIKSCIEMLSPVAKERGINIIYEPFPVAAFADEDRVRQVLLKLLANAIFYNSEGGKVEIIVTSNAYQQVEVTIEDTGIGMSSEQLSEIVNLFNRLEHSDAISINDVGLSLVKRLMLKMNGEIFIRSTQHVGSTVNLAFQAEKRN